MDNSIDMTDENARKAYGLGHDHGAKLFAALVNHYASQRYPYEMCMQMAFNAFKTVHEVVRECIEDPHGVDFNDAVERAMRNI